GHVVRELANRPPARPVGGVELLGGEAPDCGPEARRQRGDLVDQRRALVRGRRLLWMEAPHREPEPLHHRRIRLSFRHRARPRRARPRRRLRIVWFIVWFVDTTVPPCLPRGASLSKVARVRAWGSWLPASRRTCVTPGGGHGRGGSRRGRSGL